MMQDANVGATYLPGFGTPSTRSRWPGCVLALLLIQSWVFMGVAHAAFVEETALNLPVDTAQSYAFDAADINGDSIADLIVANRGQSSLLVSNGSGGFNDETSTRLPAALHTTLGASFVDVDGLNGPDLLLVGEGQNRLLMNNGAGVFSDVTASQMPVGQQTSLAVAVGDLDGDGDQDAVIANRASRNQVLINDGGGIFTDDSAARLAPDTDFSYGVALGDANADGALDIFFANFSGQNRLHTNNFLGVFTEMTDTNLPTAIGGSGDAVFLDVDSDGDQDIGVADGPAGVTLLVNGGSGVYTDAPVGQVAALNTFAVKINAGDVNFDGAVDLLVSSMGQDNVLINDGAGTFADATSSELPVDTRRTFGAQFVDADLDLDLDFVAASPGQQNRYYENAIDTPRVELSISPDYIEVTDTVTIETNVFDEDGIASISVEVVQPDTTIAPTNDLGGGFYSFVPAQIGTHIVRVTTQDGLGNIGVREATFAAQANDVTDPVVGTLAISDNPIVQGESTTFTVAATDDRTVVSLTLSVGGVNLPLNSGGQATYVPTAAGALAVVAEATDAAGNIGLASDVLQVDPDLVFPVVTLTASPDPIDITNPIAVNATAIDNINVATFAVTVTGPAGGPVDEPIVLDGSGNASYTPFIPGTYLFTATASDAAGNTATQTASVEAQGIPDNEDPVVNLTAVPGTTVPGGNVTLTVNATDNIFVLSRTLEVNGIPQTLDGINQATFSPLSIGDYTAVATATDPTGNIGTDTVTFSAVDPATDTSPPVVDISAPAEGADITSVTTFVGTATDLTLVEYTLAYRATGTSDPFTVFHTGSQVVENGALGDLDTSVLENGLVDILLTATDINGLSSSVLRVYTADGGFKPGIFTISYTDLQLNLSGIPIEIKRSYDSRHRAIADDFGNGWNLEVVQDATYTNNRVLGEGWTGLSGGLFGGFPCQGGVREDVFHITEVRFSATEFYKFAFEVELTGAFSSLGCEVASLGFTQVGGVPGATLDVLTPYPFVNVQGGNLIDFDTFNVYDPTDVRLTTLDGRIYDLNLLQGLKRIGDRNGNSLFINSNGVVHSNGTSLAFTRVGGRITTITDPAGNTLNYTYDTDGNLATFNDRANNTTSFFYVADNFLDRIEDPLGNTPLRNEYDASGRLIAQIDADGNRSEFDLDVDAGTETITDRDGTVSVFQYDEAGNLGSVDVGAASSTFTYDARGNRLTETDGNGNTTTFTYNTNDKLTSETDALGNASTYTYDSAGRIAGITDPSGAELNFEYDGNGNLLNQRDAGGGLIQGFVLNAAGNPTQVTTAAGTTALVVDADGNVIQKTLPNGAVVDYTYDALGRRTSDGFTRTASGGSTVVDVTEYEYDANGNPTLVTDALGGETLYQYDANNRKTSVTDALGRETSFSYDARGNLTRTDYPDGSFELSGYDLKDRRTAFTDTGGRTRFYEYDGNDNVTRVLMPDGSSSIATYDAANRRTSATDARGNQTTYTYDGLNRLVSEMDALGEETTYSYTGNQINPTTKTDPRAATTTYTRDTAMLFTEYLTGVEHAGGDVESQSWTANSRIASKTDENGGQSTYTYDGMGNLLTVTDAAGNVTTYTYDERGNRTSQKTDDGSPGRLTSFTYDALGRMLTRTLPEGQTEAFSYDAVGNMLAHTDFNGEVTTFEYDARDRLTRRLFTSGLDETFVYNSAGNLVSVTQTLGTDAVTSTFTYDGRDRLLTATDPNGRTVNYSYDVAGNRATVGSAAGTTTYSYDELNRIATVTDAASAVTGYEYDANGNIVGITYPNGTEATLSYDPRNRTVQVQHTGAGGTPLLADYEYTIDAAGNRTRIVEAAGRTLDFSYDALHQLTQVIEDPAGTPLVSNYTYDDVGNIVTIAIPGSSITATYDLNDRVLVAGGRDYAYDNNGNLTSITAGTDETLFEYDALNRLTERTEADGTVTSFAYDYAGNRIRRTVDGTDTEFVVDANDPAGVARVLEERNAADDLEASYVHGHGVISMDRAGAERFFHPDALGSTRRLSDDTAAVTDSYDYDAWGKVVASSGATQNDFLFGGEQQDASTGLQYLRARYYDPEIARFISRDPHPGNPLLPMTLHPYMYAWNNPQNMVDPNGEFSMVSVSISISIVGILSNIAYNSWIQPAVDEAEEILINIPNGVLNASATKEQLGWLGNDDAEELTDLVNLGGGIVEKAYKVVYGMSTTMGKVVAMIHANNSATWMKYLPAKDNIPANYVDCGFNSYVQKTYSLGLVMGTAAASRFSGAGNIIAAYMSYFNFLMLVMETVSDSQALPQPVEDADLGGAACPALGG